MKILISGSTGLIGSELVTSLKSQGHQVVRLVRQGPDGIKWDPKAGVLDARALEGFDAVIHLAGENIAGGRWTEERKRQIYESRFKGTDLLSDTLRQLQKPPQTFISASAIGYYGNRGQEILHEDSAVGTGFLADTCKSWEAAASSAARKGIRVVNLRFGVVLTPKGGALAKMLLPFKLGLGGKIGSGEQYFSWVALDEIPQIVKHVLADTSIKGPVNAVSPNPVTNAIYTATLGRVLSRPTIFPMPVFAARAAFGEMADEMLLSSQRVEPKVLAQTGYRFLHPQLEDTLRHVLDKPAEYKTL